MTAIGNLRARIVLQEELRAPDGGGGFAVAWGNVATLWAEVEPASGKEAVMAARASGKGNFIMRFRAGVAVTTAMRVLWGARVFNIRLVKNLDEAGRLIEILAEEGVAL